MLVIINPIYVIFKVQTFLLNVVYVYRLGIVIYFKRTVDIYLTDALVFVVMYI